MGSSLGSNHPTMQSGKDPKPEDAGQLPLSMQTGKVLPVLDDYPEQPLPGKKRFHPRSPRFMESQSPSAKTQNLHLAELEYRVHFRKLTVEDDIPHLRLACFKIGFQTKFLSSQSAMAVFQFIKLVNNPGGLARSPEPLS